jgi:hypothetical protein
VDWYTTGPEAAVEAARARRDARGRKRGAQPHADQAVHYGQTVGSSGGYNGGGQRTHLEQVPYGRIVGGGNNWGQQAHMDQVLYEQTVSSGARVTQDIVRQRQQEHRDQVHYGQTVSAGAGGGSGGMREQSVRLGWAETEDRSSMSEQWVQPGRIETENRYSMSEQSPRPERIEADDEAVYRVHYGQTVERDNAGRLVRIETDNEVGGAGYPGWNRLILALETAICVLK